MLVLTRKKNQKIIVSDRGRIVAKLTVADILNDRVRIGVEADRNIGVDREELFVLKQAANP